MSAAETQFCVTGVRVRGEAKKGDRVVYSDIMNQDGTVWTVVSTPEENRDPVYGWTSGYGLEDSNGKPNSSDLRQYGWVFAQ
jgi:hypothetical protein